MRPFTAEAATVAADPKYMIASGLPFLPGKLRAWVDTIASVLDIAPMLIAWFDPVLGGNQLQPASKSVSTSPSRQASANTSRLDGTALNLTPGAILRPLRIFAARRKSSRRPPPWPPSSAHCTGLPANSPTGFTLPSVGDAATCGLRPLMSYSLLSSYSQSGSEVTTSNG